MSLNNPKLVEDFDPFAVPAGSVERVRWVYGTYPDGSPASLPLCVIAGEQPGAAAVLAAGVHGDEYEGVHALWQLMRTLTPAQICGRVLIVPVAHGAAYNAGLRTSPMDGVNLARVFPGDPDATISYRLAHHLFDQIVRHADVVVDCHSGGVRMAFLPVAGFYAAGGDISPTCADASLEAARAMGLPWLWALPHRAGVMSYEAARLGIPVTGCEIGGRGGRLEGDSTQYVTGISGVLRAWDILEGKRTVPSRTPILTGDWQVAPASGLIVHHVELGARVRAGTTVASILDVFGETIAVLNAPHDGLIAGQRHLPSLHMGELAYWVAQEADPLY